jgi:hypothetical protein
MKKVYTARHPADAHLIRGFLDDSGIAAKVLDEMGDGYGAVRPSVWVLNDAECDRAQRLLADRKGQAAPEYCEGCGYNLWGLPEPRCPECGRPFARPESWVCSDCGETIDGQFAACWKCAAKVEGG